MKAELIEFAEMAVYELGCATHEWNASINSIFPPIPVVIQALFFINILPRGGHLFAKISNFVCIHSHNQVV